MSDNTLSVLDGLRNDLKRAVHAISLIQSAMAEGVIADEKDAPEALFFVWERLYDISEKISSQVDSVYNMRRAIVHEQAN